MASEIEIREAIVARIESALSVGAGFNPAPRVFGDDVTGILESGSFSGLLDADDKIHVWVVTQRSMLPADEGRSIGQLYDLVYNVTQIYQFRSGTELSNSIRDASLERDAVINAFRAKSELPTILKKARVEPIEWQVNEIDRPEPITRGTARQSKAILRASNFYGPVGCA